MADLALATDVICQRLADAGRDDWAVDLRAALDDALVRRAHGHWSHWRKAIDDLPQRDDARFSTSLEHVELTTGCALTPSEDSRLAASLEALKPWRKGPFKLFDRILDAEWRCDQKWARLIGDLEPLAGRRVLDVGSGNGWYSWQMRGAGASEVVAVDPTALFLAQFQVMQRYLLDQCMHFLPLPLEALTVPRQPFDTVFSMGVLYHRRSPLDHLAQLRDQLRAGGQLVLETLIIEGDEQAVLVPSDRYARMRNVWFLPSVALLQRWLERVGFTDVSLLDVTPTLPQEQRVTHWSSGQSLVDFLDPHDSTRTIEGHPAPLRATLVAQR